MTSYRGHVNPGGSSATRALTALSIAKLSVGLMDNNCYLLTCRTTGEAVIIDAAADAPRILDLLDAGPGAAAVKAIITTHQHADHWQALANIHAATGAVTYAGAADAAELPVEVQTPVEHGDDIVFGAIKLKVIGLRGHTPGSIALAYDDPGGCTHIFTGDSLFPGGPGKTWSATDFTSLLNDLEQRIFDVFDDDTWIYPGHGDDTTLGAERPQLADWRARGW